jgi:hypothetical protein
MVNEVEIFFQKYILTLQPNGEPLTFAFFFIFWVDLCGSIFKKKWMVDFCRILRMSRIGQGCAALLLFELRWLME